MIDIGQPSDADLKAFKYWSVIFKGLFEVLVARDILKAKDVDFIFDKALKVLEGDNVNKQQ